MVTPHEVWLLVSWLANTSPMQWAVRLDTSIKIFMDKCLNFKARDDCREILLPPLVSAWRAAPGRCVAAAVTTQLQIKALTYTKY